MNKVIILGRLGADPKIHGEGEVVSLSVATSDFWVSKNGEKKHHTEWHRVVLFGKTAHFAALNLRKGHRVLVEGNIRTREYQDKRYTEILANKLHAIDMLDLNAPVKSKPTTASPHKSETPSIMSDAPYDDIPF